MENHIKNFDGWNEVKKKVNNKNRALIKQGKVYWCNLGINVGVEQNGKDNNFQRPIIVIKKFSNKIVLGAPLTTKIHKGNWYFDIEIKNKKVQVILNQIKPLDTKRLLNELFEIPENKIKHIIKKYIELIQ